MLDVDELPELNAERAEGSALVPALVPSVLPVLESCVIKACKLALNWLVSEPAPAL